MGVDLPVKELREVHWLSKRLLLFGKDEGALRVLGMELYIIAGRWRDHSIRVSYYCLNPSLPLHACPNRLLPMHLLLPIVNRLLIDHLLHRSGLLGMHYFLLLLRDELAVAQIEPMVQLVDVVVSRRLHLLLGRDLVGRLYFGLHSDDIQVGCHWTLRTDLIGIAHKNLSFLRAG